MGDIDIRRVCQHAWCRVRRGGGSHLGQEHEARDTGRHFCEADPVNPASCVHGVRTYPYVPTTDVPKFCEALQTVVLTPTLPLYDLCRHNNLARPVCLSRGTSGPMPSRSA